MNLSNRAAKLMGEPSQIVKGMMICAENPHSLSNPEGYLNFGVAQNFLVDDLILPKLNDPIEHAPSHIQYNELNGRADFRLTVAEFLMKFLRIKQIRPDQLTVQCGVSAICESLAFAMFDEGDYIILPTPYYTGFDHDFTKRFKVNFLYADLDPKDHFTHHISAFQKAYDECPEKDKIKAVLITDPHNPTGEILSDIFKTDIINFCADKNIALISDEIYALSIHDNTRPESLYQQAYDAGIDAHLLYGMAKDFAIAGLKVGFYYSENSTVSKAMQDLSYFHTVSTTTQIAVNNILKDHDFINSFINENQSRLRPIPLLIEQQLPQLDFISSRAGLFMMLNLSSLCSNMKDEAKLFQKLIDDYRINISPGSSLGLKTPGYFRVCFAQRKEAVLEFIVRMRKFCERELS